MKKKIPTRPLTLAQQQIQAARRRSQGNNLTRKFDLLWKSLEGPELVKEFRFHPVRMWRADYCHEGSKVLIELEGGIWVNGAHTRGGHYESDCQKYLAAAMLGYAVLRFTSSM